MNTWVGKEIREALFSLFSLDRALGSSLCARPYLSVAERVSEREELRSFVRQTGRSVLVPLYATRRRWKEKRIKTFNRICQDLRCQTVSARTVRGFFVRGCRIQKMWMDEPRHEDEEAELTFPWGQRIPSTLFFAPWSNCHRVSFISFRVHFLFHSTFYMHAFSRVEMQHAASVSPSVSFMLLFRLSQR